MTRRTLILDTTVRLIFDAVLVLSVYLLFAGHNQPGGGFVGGLIAGAAVSLRYLAGGLDDVHALGSLRPWTLSSWGLLLVAGTTLTPLIFGSEALDHRSFAWDVPAIGHVKLTTATIFDAGVYLIVVGLILMIFEALGESSADAHLDAEQRT